MSKPKKYEYVSDGYTARFINPKTGHAAPYGEYVRWEDYAKVKEAGQNMLQHLRESTYEVALLKAEVERLTAFTTRTIIPNEELKAQVERLTKAGDAMASSIQFNEEMAQDYNGPTIVHQSVQRWNAAKEGKGQP